MNFENHEIAKELIEHWDEIHDGAYPQDWLTQFADELVPIYYDRIIDDWTQMPHEYDDQGQEHVANDSSILARMTADLYVYYSAMVQEQYEKILEEKNA